VATLAVYRGDQFLRYVELGEAPLRIGRSPENELILEDRDKQVSRTHAVIRFERGRYMVQDLKSQNGVWIGDRRVKSDPLPTDVPITVGPYRLVLLAEASLPTMALPVEETYLSSAPPPQPEEHIAEPTEPAAPGVQSSQTQRGQAAAPSSRKGLLIAAAVVVAVVAVGAALVRVVFKSRTEPPQQATTTVPPGPTAEERFQDHFNKAQELITKSEKESALTENKEALAALPDDPRGLKQKAEIDAMATPLVDPPLVPEGTAPPSTAAGPTPAPGPPTPGSASTPGSSPMPAGSPSALAPTLRVAIKENETLASRSNREKYAKTFLDEGKKALEERHYPEAIEKLALAIENGGRQDYGYTPNEASSLLQKARAAQAAADNAVKAATAQKLIEEAKAAAGSNLVEAIGKLREARNLNPQGFTAADLLSGLEDKARVQGETALRSARNLDIDDKRRDQALREFERAVQLLGLVPGGHPDLAGARQRLNELKSGR
jgi:hypothetical protein